MFHSVKSLHCVLLTVSIIPIMIPFQYLSLFILLKRVLICLLLYNIITLLSLCIIHFVVKNNKNICLICHTEPRNFLTYCSICKNFVCTRCYINISLRSLSYHRCKYVCPFCRDINKKYINPASIISVNAQPNKSIIIDFINYIYTLL